VRLHRAIERADGEVPSPDECADVPAPRIDRDECGLERLALACCGVFRRGLSRAASDARMASSAAACITGSIVE
jgi:hypothetical protein